MKGPGLIILIPFVQQMIIVDSGLSGQLAPWHDSFRQGYFSDLSFLLVSNVLGSQETIQLKFEIVRNFLATGKQATLAKIIDDFPDICVGLI